MNPVPLAMDGLLAVLLLVAVAVGLRLNGKLKLLREGQGQFVRAVGDLDAAAARAEAGLSALRGATEETHDALLTRIETARGLLPRLDRANEDAAASAARLEEGVRAADAAGRRAQSAADTAARRTAEAAERDKAVERPVRRSPSAEPIPFPALRREAPRGLAEALAAAERIAAAEVAPEPPAPAPVREAASSRAAAADSRLARFVARRQEARA